MLKNRHEQIQLLVRLTDMAITGFAFLVAYGIRTSPYFFSGRLDIGGLESVIWLLAVSVALKILLYPACGFYQSLRLKSAQDIVTMVLKALTVEFFVLGGLVFLFQAKETSRYFFGFFILINYSLVLAEKIGVRALLMAFRKRGYNYRQLLVVGTGANAEKVLSSLHRNKHWGYIPCGCLREPGSGTAPRACLDVPVLGELGDLESVLLGRTVDEVIFALDSIRAAEIQGAIQLCERLGIASRLSLGLFDLPSSKVTFTMLEQVPIVTFYTSLMTPAQAGIKRLMDIVVALVGLAITAVLYPWIAWRIRRESPGPVFFKQVRVGENGRKFKCYKFRTMYADADSRKKELLDSNQMQGPIFKIENDPRVTSFGAFLRKSSLDELPQFLNILRGDMAVVGTRPPTPDEVQQYEPHFRRRLSIRPGLTGLWQVSGRNKVSRFEDILALDLEYIDNWSIWLDLKIILRTIWVALFRVGAS